MQKLEQQPEIEVEEFKSGQRHTDPTEEEIKDRAAFVRSKWNVNKEASRRGVIKHVPWTPPVISNQTFDEVYCE